MWLRPVRGATFPAMRIIVLPLAGTLIACGSPAGVGTGMWRTPAGEREVSAPAVAGWCPERSRILLELADERGTVGVLWRYGALVPESLRVVSPQPADSAVIPVPSASVALRYVEGAEVLGHVAFAGSFQVTAIDSASITAAVQAKLESLEGTDTTDLTARFSRVPLTVDPTVCER